MLETRKNQPAPESTTTNKQQGNLEIPQTSQSQEASVVQLNTREFTENTQDIRGWAREWFENFYQNECDELEPYSRSGQLDEILENLEKITGTDKVTKETGINKFFSELVEFAEEKLNDPKQEEKAKIFVQNLYYGLLTQMPRSSPKIPYHNKLLFTAWVTSSSEFDNNFTDEIISNMSWFLDLEEEEHCQEIPKKIAGQPVEVILDVVHMLKTFGTRAAEDGSYHKLYERSKNIISEIKQRVNLPLVQYEADLALDFFDSKASESRFHNWRISKLVHGISESRIWEEPSEQIIQDHKELSKKITPVQKFQIGPMSQVAKDAVAILDNSMTPRYISRISIENLTDKESKPQVSENFVSYNTLAQDQILNPFARSKGGQLPLLLKRLHRPDLKNKVEKDLRISFNALPLRSQVHFLRFLAGQDQAGFARIRSVLHSHPDQANNILNSFLACAEYVDYGQAILNISEKADTALSGKIFTKYNEIVNLGEEVRNNLDNYFGPQSGIIDVNVLVRNLLQKANGLLLNYSQQLKHPSGQTNQQELLQGLDQVQAEVLVFASGIKAAIKGERVDWRNIPGVKEEEKESAELTANQKAIMLQIFKANREKTYPPKLFTHTVEDFENTINQPGHTFRLLYHNNSLLAFFHYDEDVNKKEIYVGSLNLNPNATDTPIAVFMVFEALNEKPDYKLNAVVWAKNPARMFYTKFLGFKKVGEIADYHNTGEKYWELVRPAKAEQVELPKAA